MMCSTLSNSTANWMADSAFRSECTTMFATFLWTNTSPGSRPVIWLAGTRLSEQPIHMYLGVCCFVRPVKKPGRSRSIWAAQERLWAKRSWMWGMDSIVSFRHAWIAGQARNDNLHRFREQFPPDEHPADLAGAR